MNRDQPITPQPASKRTGGLLAYLGLGSSKAASGTSVLKALEARLPDTDPLRRARLQTQLFQDQLPAFPQVRTAEPVTAQAPPSGLPARKAAAPAEAKTEGADTRTAAESPVRRRVAALRTRRQVRPPTRPASSLRPSARVGRPGTAQARATAARTPARTAISSLDQSPNHPSSRPNTAIAKRSRGRTALRFLGMLLLLAFLVAALFWFSPGWYRGATGSGADLGSAAEAFDAVTPPAQGNSQTAEGGIPTAEGADTVPDPLLLPTPVELEAQAYEDAVFRLERYLNLKGFLTPNMLVDGIYTFETRAALLELIGMFTTYRGLSGEMANAGVNPTREELERWYDVIETIF